MRCEKHFVFNCVVFGVVTNVIYEWRKRPRRFGAVLGAGYDRFGLWLWTQLGLKQKEQAHVGLKKGRRRGRKGRRLMLSSLQQNLNHYFLFMKTAAFLQNAIPLLRNHIATIPDLLRLQPSNLANCLPSQCSINANPLSIWLFTLLAALKDNRL